MKIYDDGAETLEAILAKAAGPEGSTLLVPDLQRPYVWGPTQVTLLVDSIFRGWPFGTLLLWNVRDEEFARIPSRPFWQIVDRTGADAAVAQFSGAPPAEFRMVLDGQQRIQSMVLAFSGDQSGFRLFDQDWQENLREERRRGRRTKHWSHGQLCLDVGKFGEEYSRCQRLANIDFRNVLAWVSTTSSGTSRTRQKQGYKYPLLDAVEAPGRFVRLSRLWSAASTVPGRFEDDHQRSAKEVLLRNGIEKDQIEHSLKGLGQLLMTMAAIKQSKVSYLQLSAFEADRYEVDQYNEAIVNIFTRLNTAGRALSKQEITFAWIKSGWQSSYTGGRTAGQCFEDLLQELKEQSVDIEIDSLVTAVSLVWSVAFGDGSLLAAADLLKSNKVRPLAKDLSEHWTNLSSVVLDCLVRLKTSGLIYNEHYRSLNALFVLVAWRFLAESFVTGNAIERDAARKRIEHAFDQYADRWLLLSQWSRRWNTSTDSTLQTYITLLHQLRRDKAKSEVNLEAAFAQWDSCMKECVSELIPDANTEIRSLQVHERNEVHQYYVPLWVWHNLDRDRAAAVTTILRRSVREKPEKPEVDHIVAVGLWQKLGFTDGADDDESSEEGITRGSLHDIGNCSLLTKTFNVSKSDKAFNEFLNGVFEFKSKPDEAEKWAAKLAIMSEQYSPHAYAQAAIRKAIEVRTDRIKNDLRLYVEGRLGLVGPSND